MEYVIKIIVAIVVPVTISKFVFPEGLKMTEYVSLTRVYEYTYVKNQHHCYKYC
jgi:hypothetical protein